MAKSGNECARNRCPGKRERGPLPGGRPTITRAVSLPIGTAVQGGVIREGGGCLLVGGKKGEQEYPLWLEGLKIAITNAPFQPKRALPVTRIRPSRGEGEEFSAKKKVAHGLRGLTYPRNEGGRLLFLEKEKWAAPSMKSSGKEGESYPGSGPSPPR